MSAVHAMEHALGVVVDGQLRALRRALYCSEWIESQVILIDAVSSSALPGTIYQFDALHQTIPVKVSFGSTHGFGVAEAVMRASVLEQLPSKLFVYGIEGRDFSLHRGLSPEVEKSVQEVSESVLQTLRGWHI